MKNKNFFEDLTTILGGKLASCVNMKSEFDKMLKGKIENYLKNLDLPSCEDFEVLKSMVTKISVENQELRQEIEKLKKNSK